MTRANRRTCNQWSHPHGKDSGHKSGECEQCGSKTVQKSHALFVCLKCGLEQSFHHTDDQ